MGAVQGVGETGYAVVVGTIAGSFDVVAPAVSRAIMLDCEDCCRESYGGGVDGVKD